MRLFRKIDATTGNFLEDVLFDENPTDGVEYSYIEQAPMQGFYLPRWTGTEWVEGGQVPEPTEPELSVEEKIFKLAEQVVVAQTAIDFLLMGGM